MISISKINLSGMPASESDLKNIYALFKDVLKKANIKDNSELSNGEIKLHYIDGKYKKWFHTLKKNRIHLEEGDERIKKFGKKVLESDRLNEKQYDIACDLILNKIRSLGYSASIVYQEFQNDEASLIELVKGKEVVGKFPRPNNFPSEA
jgi:hypothetical protein